MEKWLAEEAEEASKVKRDTPVMIVLGNPPYNVSSINRSEWIQSLISKYKKNLNEKKINLDDDYIKFIRYGQYFIDNNLSGILAYISNNSFIDGITHREMRKSLLESFDKIYILDLHGNSKKKETNIDGSPDVNVFDIQQGVSINIFVKTGKKQDSELGKVYHSDILGKREVKYSFLSSNTVASVNWAEIAPLSPYFFFVPKNFDNRSEYEKGFSISKLFNIFNNGIKTDRDTLFIDMNRDALASRIKTLLSGNFDKSFQEKFNVNDSGSYKLTKVIQGKKFDTNCLKSILYRPLDFRYIYYQHGVTSRPAYIVMKHLFNTNFAIISARQFQEDFGVFVTENLAGHKTCSAYDINCIFPLYLYPDENSLDKEETRRPNLNPSIVQEIAGKTGLIFTGEKDDTENTFAPIDLLDYIYAVLYSNNYRTKYKEFLKIDFPRIPYPKNAEQFQKLVSIGSLLRSLHLMENVSPLMDLADFPIAGTNEIEAVNYKGEKVYINKTQYFENISPEIWGYYIGGYQPAEKWLKDRKGRRLSFEDIEHYQKIIAVLKMTMELQAQIDEISPF
jgi:predicted helicase